MPRWLCRWRGPKQISTPKSEDLIRYKEKILKVNMKRQRSAKAVCAQQKVNILIFVFQRPYMERSYEKAFKWPPDSS